MTAWVMARPSRPHAVTVSATGSSPNFPLTNPNTNKKNPLLARLTVGTVSGVCGGFQSQLATIESLIKQRAFGVFGHLFLGLAARRQQVRQQVRHNAHADVLLHKAVRAPATAVFVLNVLRAQVGLVRAAKSIGGHAEVVRLHDRGIERREVQHQDQALASSIEAPLRRDDRSTLVLVLVDVVVAMIVALGVRSLCDDVAGLVRLHADGRVDLDLLAAHVNGLEGSVGHPGHLDIADGPLVPLDDIDRQVGVAVAVDANAVILLGVVPRSGVVHLLVVHRQLLHVKHRLGQVVELVELGLQIALDLEDAVDDYLAIGLDDFLLVDAQRRRVDVVVSELARHANQTAQVGKPRQLMLLDLVVDVRPVEVCDAVARNHIGIDLEHQDVLEGRQQLGLALDIVDAVGARNRVLLQRLHFLLGFAFVFLDELL